MFRKKRDLGEQARIALEYARTHHDCIEWTALDAFRIWYQRPTEDGLELTCIEFQVKELR